MTQEDDQARYLAASHAMQSGVAAEQGAGSPDGTPKHLRIGVNSAQVSVAALARLLIDRGLFTEAEYVAAQADEMEAEVARYEQRISEATGATVTLR